MIAFRCVAVAVRIRIEGANEHNLHDVDVEFGDGLTVVTGVSGSGKSSLVFSVDSIIRPLPALGGRGANTHGVIAGPDSPYHF